MSQEAQQARKAAVYARMGQQMPAPKPDPRTPSPAEIDAGQVVRQYKGAAAMQTGIAQMAAQGWRVQTQSSYQPRAGVGRWATIGVLALVFKPRAAFIVTYTR
jgi:hypothetical protein